MSNLSIKDVPEPWAEALRRRAARHHRSLQGELIAMVEAVVNDEAAGLHNAELPAPKPLINLQRRKKAVDEIALEMRLRFPELAVSEPLAVDIIRAERDAR
jgi:antitoxin FitA